MTENLAYAILRGAPAIFLTNVPILTCAVASHLVEALTIAWEIVCYECPPNAMVPITLMGGCLLDADLPHRAPRRRPPTLPNPKPYIGWMCMRAEARIPPSSRRATHAQVKFNQGGFITAPEARGRDVGHVCVCAPASLWGSGWVTWSVAARRWPAARRGRRKKKQALSFADLYKHPLLRKNDSSLFLQAQGPLTRGSSRRCRAISRERQSR